jgi:serine protein kinase
MQRVPIYVLSANGERSPVNDHPLCLFNPQEDAQILDKEFGIPPLSRHHHVAVGGKTPA